MRPVTLLLTTPRGDELGRLRLPDVVVAAAGEQTAPSGVRLREAMTDFYRRLEETLQREGMAVDLDPIELRITAGRALLGSEDASEVLIPVLVREVGAASGSAGPLPRNLSEEPLNLDDLFDLGEMDAEDKGHD
jgi:hypothetical protein